jgi:hypothetical protein
MMNRLDAEDDIVAFLTAAHSILLVPQSTLLTVMKYEIDESDSDDNFNDDKSDDDTSDN